MDSQIAESIVYMKLSQGSISRALDLLNEREPYKSLPRHFKNLVEEALFYARTAIGA